MSYANAYKKTQAETASPQRLMALLFQAALRHIREGAQGLEAKQLADCRTHFAKASAIVTELARTLDPQQAPQLAAELGPLYLFVARQLYVANIKYDLKAARDAERVFAPIAEAFSQAVAQATAVTP